MSNVLKNIKNKIAENLDKIKKLKMLKQVD
jgi:hypothetical protein